MTANPSHHADAALLSYAQCLAAQPPPPPPLRRAPRQRTLKPRLLEDCDQLLRVYFVAKNASLDPVAAPPRSEQPTVHYVNLNSKWRQSYFGRYVASGGRWRPPWV
jgi:hypothetical protein